MSDPYLAELRIFPYNFAPMGWAVCNGQLVAISQNTALFSLLGTTYGGDGRVTFGLPNLQGSLPMHFGQGPGLSDRVEGEVGGAVTVTLTTGQTPAHTHVLRGFASRFHEAPLSSPANNVVTVTESTSLYDPAVPPSPAVMDGNAVATAGRGQGHNNLMPYLPLTICIAMAGIFPPRG
ncbi:MAG TPA: tail fiber protein [Solirubrobacteraceae bacterium]|jgi:microcystin-dependent protein|nr:tail fiber protein [Solirubrobacteraceae bacterium]